MLPFFFISCLNLAAAISEHHPQVRSIFPGKILFFFFFFHNSFKLACFLGGMAYYPSLGELIRKEMREKKLSACFLANRLYEHLNFNSPDAAKNYISWVRKESIYGNTSVRAREKVINVERLAIFLYGIGFTEDYLIIHAIRRDDARFVYPPVVGVSYDRLGIGEGVESRI